MIRRHSRKQLHWQQWITERLCPLKWTLPRIINQQRRLNTFNVLRGAAQFPLDCHSWFNFPHSESLQCHTDAKPVQYSHKKKFHIMLYEKIFSNNILGFYHLLWNSLKHFHQFEKPLLPKLIHKTNAGKIQVKNDRQNDRMIVKNNELTKCTKQWRIMEKV